MVKLVLRIGAMMENVANLRVSDGYYWAFKYQCSSCNTVSDKFVEFTASEQHEMPGSRGSANLVLKCKFCRRDASLDVLASNLGSPEQDDPAMVDFAQFECRGMDLVDFRPGTGFVVDGSNGAPTFEDIDLSEREWVDYDEKNGCSVGILSLTWEIRRA